MNLIEFLTTGSTAFLISLSLTPVLIKLAHHVGMVSLPREERWHQNPTALLGGVAIFCSFSAAILFSGLLEIRVLSLLAGTALIFVVGIVDDLWHLAPLQKLMGQVIAASIPIFNEIVFVLPCNNFIAALVTLLWVVGIINAVNLLDNMDGLATGVTAISAGFLFIFATQNNLPEPALFAVCLGGATLGFLPYNFNPAKIFMGDAGSFVLGYVMATATTLAQSQLQVESVQDLLIPIALLGMPIFDTAFVIVVRTLNQRQIWQGGKDHTSHRLVALGISDRSTVLILYGISIMFALFALAERSLSSVLCMSLMFLILAMLLGFGYFLAQAKIYPAD